jgi:hypothetical protein
VKARILLYDIESSPLITYTWGLYEQNVTKVLQDWHLLCFAYKWLGEKKVKVKGLPDYPLYKKDPKNDRELAKDLHKLFDEADIIIAHNGDSFDQKMSQTRFMVHKLGPTSSYKQLDTKKIAKKYSRFSSNKLDDLGKYLSLGQKLDTGGIELWHGCMNGDMKSWKKMMTYNKQDVVLLEQLYMELRPWVDNHPGMNLLLNRPNACPKCGEEGEIKSKGYRISKTGKYHRWQCEHCGGHFQGRTPEKPLEKVKYVN